MSCVAAQGPTRFCEPSYSQSLPCDPLKQKREFGMIDPVALHDETDQGIAYQLSERTLGDVHDISLLPPQSCLSANWAAAV